MRFSAAVKLPWESGDGLRRAATGGDGEATGAADDEATEGREVAEDAAEEEDVVR